MLKRRRLRGLILTAALGLLNACAVTPPLTEAQKISGFAEFRSNPFVPVNVHVNPGDFVNQYEAEDLKYLRSQLSASLAFKRVDFGVQRWPHTLEIRFGASAAADTAEVAGVLLSAGTLGIIPAPINRVYFLEVEAFQGPLPLQKLRFEEPIKERFSIVDIADERKFQRAAIDRLLPRMLAGLREANLVPSAKDVLERGPLRPGT